ncbi:hypothetical protein IFM89_015883 [Coptis chinensis]|uniref:Pentatricopeptide repeat-containing protein n=1 Tax=Coptis chinensis TaxID=261450 RepID=A0A835HVQ4_9MAGN|nr:hypothetical protein IFM89_015883 [Coptis chinensis]
MRRVLKITDASAKAESLRLYKKPIFPRPKILIPPPPLSSTSTLTKSQARFFDAYPKLISLFTEKETNGRIIHKTNRQRFIHKTEDVFLSNEVAQLCDELVSNQFDSKKVFGILEDKVVSLIRIYSNGAAFVSLLEKLKPWPLLFIKVFNWRREKCEAGLGMVSEEYVKGITIAGRTKNVDLAVILFKEASDKGIKTSSTYNALMGACMYNDLPDKCQSLFRDLKREITCGPTIVTYNILLSVFGRLMLVDHMEATFRDIENSNLTPNLNTYNYIIYGYVTAWMWEDMERVYRTMEEGPVKPEVSTHLLMLRGYSHSGNLEKMEKTYEIVKDHINENEVPLIRVMISAYCKSSDKDRVSKVEALLKLIPEGEYRAWLNVMLIKLYAQEDLVDTMENFIGQAFEHNTSVNTVGVMRLIIASYFRCDTVERLTSFVNRAESSDWRICRSLYHCKMVMYSSANRLEEMENVLKEMERFNFDPTKKTFLIMYKAYSHWGQRSRVMRLLGTMCKHGFQIPSDYFSS